MKNKLLPVLFLSLLIVACKTNEPEYPNWEPELEPIANFSFKTEQPLKAVFTNKSTNATSYEWDFGDGTTSTEESPIHRYKSIGVYRVKLKAKKGSNVDTKQTNVTIEAPTTCCFTGFTIIKIPNNNYYYQVQLTDNYVLSKTTYLWTSWFLLSSANLPYNYNFSSPKVINTSYEYVIRLYKSSSKQSSQASGKGDFSVKLTPDDLKTYPEGLVWSNTSLEMNLNFQWK